MTDPMCQAAALLSPHVNFEMLQSPLTRAKDNWWRKMYVTVSTLWLCSGFQRCACVCACSKKSCPLVEFFGGWRRGVVRGLAFVFLCVCGWAHERTLSPFLASRAAKLRCLGSDSLGTRTRGCRYNNRLPPIRASTPLLPPCTRTLPGTQTDQIICFCSTWY